MNIDWAELFFTSGGRVNRAKYWIAQLVCFSVLLIIAALGYSFSALGYAGPVIGFIAGVILSIVGLILTVLVTVATITVGIKRLHDRNKSAWWLLLFYGVPGVIGGWYGTYTGLGLSLFLASFAIWIWTIVELGCLRGTEGSNQYGPDPLAGTTA